MIVAGFEFDQDDPVALFLQRATGLGAGIVEFAGLSDDDRSGADDEDRFDIGTFRHEPTWLAACEISCQRFSAIIAMNRSNR